MITSKRAHGVAVNMRSMNAHTCAWEYVRTDNTKRGTDNQTTLCPYYMGVYVCMYNIIAFGPDSWVRCSGERR